MVKLEFLSKLPFLDIYQKNSTRSFFGAWSFLFVHIHFTPSEGPEGFVNFFSFKKSDHESWTIKLEHDKRPISMVQLHGLWCKPTLSDLPDLTEHRNIGIAIIKQHAHNIVTTTSTLLMCHVFIGHEHNEYRT